MEVQVVANEAANGSWDVGKEEPQYSLKADVVALGQICGA
jgi:hypothetical protein